MRIFVLLLEVTCLVLPICIASSNPFLNRCSGCRESPSPSLREIFEALEHLENELIDSVKRLAKKKFVNSAQWLNTMRKELTKELPVLHTLRDELMILQERIKTFADELEEILNKSKNRALISVAEQLLPNFKKLHDLLTRRTNGKFPLSDPDQKYYGYV